MNVWLKSETSTTVTFAWDRVAGARGFRFTTPAGKVSHTWDGARTDAKFAKADGVFLIEPLHVTDVGQGVYPPADPPDPPVTEFGEDLRAFLPPLPAPPGPVVSVATNAELQTALARLESGQLVRGTVVDGGDRTFNVGYTTFRFKHTQNVTTCLRRMTIVGGFETCCSRMLFDRVHFRGGVDALKLVSWTPWGGVCNDVELIDCSLQDATRQGLLVGADGMHNLNVAVRRTIFRNNGSVANGNLDHNLYTSALRKGVFEACLVQDAAAYDMQLYPAAENIVVSSCVSDGTRGTTGGRGGILAGDEGGGTTKDVRAYGCVSTGSKNGYEGFSEWLNPQRLSVSDSVGTTSPKWAATRCVVFDPQYVRNAAGRIVGMGRTHPVDPSVFGWLAPTNLDGTPRTRGVAGCFA